LQLSQEASLSYRLSRNELSVTLTLTGEMLLQFRLLHHACRTTQSESAFLQSLLRDLLADDAAAHSMGSPSEARH